MLFFVFKCALCINTCVIRDEDLFREHYEDLFGMHELIWSTGETTPVLKILHL